MEETVPSCLPEADRIYLQFFCLSCGSLLSTNSLKAHECEMCQAAVLFCTETSLVEELELVPDDVKIAILEYINQNRASMWAYRLANLRCRVMPPSDEKFLGFFCMACGAVFASKDFDTRKCGCCGAVIQPADVEQLRLEFSVASEQAQRKIMYYIVRRRITLDVSMFFCRSRTNIS